MRDMFCNVDLIYTNWMSIDKLDIYLQTLFTLFIYKDINVVNDSNYTKIQKTIHILYLQFLCTKILSLTAFNFINCLTKHINYEDKYPCLCFKVLVNQYKTGYLLRDI